MNESQKYWKKCAPLAKLVLVLFAVLLVILGFRCFARHRYYVTHCVVEDCDRMRAEGFKYCAAHKCCVEECPELATDHHYCAEHWAVEKPLRCVIKDCRNHHVEGGKYCKSHTCREPGCFNKVYTSVGYCYEHRYDHTYTHFSYLYHNFSSSGSGKSSSGYSSGSSGSSSAGKSGRYTYSADDSYEDGYDEYYMDGDYDEDRYYSDPDYADGVDEAMEELGEW